MGFDSSDAASSSLELSLAGFNYGAGPPLPSVGMVGTAESIAGQAGACPAL